LHTGDVETLGAEGKCRVNLINKSPSRFSGTGVGFKRRGVGGTVLVLAAFPPELSFSENWELFAGGEATTSEQKTKH